MRPLLSVDFFKKNPPSLSFFEKWKDSSDWSTECLPIYEWQGLLFVAVTSEKIIPPRNLRCLLVIAPKDSLISLWQQWHAASDDPFSTLQRTVATKASEPSLFDSIETDPIAPPPAPSIDEILDLNNVDHPTTQTVAVATDSTAKISQQQQKASEAAVFSKLVAEPKENLPKDPNKLDPVEINLMFAKNDWLSEIFEWTEEYFEKSMLLLRDGITLRPWKWTTGFQSVADTPSGISLEEASAFRIVFRTNKTFHGYVVSSPINNKFFNEWNMPEPVGTLTIAPILIDDSLLGVLVGFSSVAAFNFDAVASLEKLAMSIGRTVKRDPNLLKVA